MTKINKKSVLSCALEYRSRGWSIIPIGKNKKPPRGLRWKPYQTTQPDKAQLRKWFANGKYTSLAVVCGAVSGGLTVLDFDSMCYELQLVQKNKPFWLSCYDAAGIIGLSHTEANKRLQMLVADEVLKLVKKNTTQKATRFRYAAG